MAAAVDAARAAKAVASEMEAAASRQRARLAQLDSEIEALRITSPDNQFADSVSEFENIASKLRITLREIRSLPLTLAELGRGAFNRNDMRTRESVSARPSECAGCGFPRLSRAMLKFFIPSLA
jgi:hypothetical protein